MNEENITKVSWEEFKKMPDSKEDKTDWERLRNMTEEEIEQNALDDPDNPPWTEEELEKVEPVVYHNFEEWRKAHES